MILRRAIGSTILVLTCFAGTAHAEEAPAATEPAASAVAPSAQPPPAESHRTAWPWIVMGTGIALVVTAAVVEVHAVKEDDRREADEVKLFSLPQGDPQRKELQASAQSHDDSATNGRTAALIVGTVGFLAMAGAVVWWFVEGGSSAPAASASNGTTKAQTKALKPSFVPSLAPGYAGATLGATF
ncbi:MAG: hypothetical protein JWP87_3488 [Labilithrix sp.]|nr:hypothetical protein [Labilithrix sp.]